MSTENEGTAVPPAPSAPPVPVDAPASAPGATPEGHAPSGPVAGAPGPDAGSTPLPEGAPYPARPEGVPYPAPSEGAPTTQFPPVPPGQPGAPSAAGADWPPPPPVVPSYAGGGGGAGGAWGASYQEPAPKPRKGRGGMVAAILVAALVAGGVGGGIGYQLAKNDDSTGSTTVSAATSGGDVRHDNGSVAAVAAAALPSTVTIEAESTNGQGGTGTGFVFDAQGHIVTNNHVVADAVDGGKLTATFPNGKKYDAEIIGHAQGYDVAVIKLKNPPSDLKPLALGDSDKVAVGDATIAIGAPFGLSNTVTAGIISAKHRPVASSDGSSSSKASYMSALQTDASINPGNSGGPLLDARGAVIGINSAIQSTGSSGLGSSGQSGSIGLGFAIPINQAKYVAQQLIKTGKPVYAKIGASVSLEDSSGGAKITDQGAAGSAPVESGGPADKAGLKPGDVITKLDDTVIDSGPTLIGEIWTHKPGDKVTITYERDGKTHTTDVTLGSRAGDD
ncbi:S1C family serine protease [Streptomyces gibsoniae]|uniref:Trypsin-like peptidase domain-containing protein n=1 Tax=Streptomyces gibsoniae TaxID=3075529 RepID=A0ABU2TQM8_9ACTN|nr:trypsin-like peptidase domain-containing protein [Streptomyces sp. DSM 41699]MDT0463249.1 trypsin-like peptidase domain-containing protein [Streptomyces sp. DSM 41699]